MKTLEGFVRVKEAAEILGVSPNTVRTWGAEGRLTEFRHPVNNYRLFKREELEELIERIQNPPTFKKKKAK